MQSHSCSPSLTKITRCQQFLTYLVVRSANLPSSSLLSDNHHLHVLKAISWSVRVTVNVDPSKPLGQRVTFVGPVRQCDPQILDVADAPSLTENALRPPNANSSQILIWWPAGVNEEPLLVVKPSVTTRSTVETVRTFQHPHTRHPLAL